MEEFELSVFRWSTSLRGDTSTWRHVSRLSLSNFILSFSVDKKKNKKQSKKRKLPYSMELHTYFLSTPFIWSSNFEQIPNLLRIGPLHKRQLPVCRQGWKMLDLSQNPGPPLLYQREQFSAQQHDFSNRNRVNGLKREKRTFIVTRTARWIWNRHIKYHRRNQVASSVWGDYTFSSKRPKITQSSVDAESSHSQTANLSIVQVMITWMSIARSLLTRFCIWLVHFSRKMNRVRACVGKEATATDNANVIGKAFCRRLAKTLFPFDILFLFIIIHFFRNKLNVLLKLKLENTI